MSKPVILTGLRANNDLHIGNYLGAMLPMVDMAKTHAGEYQLNFFVPDLHSFTTPIDHSQLYTQTINNLRMYVAAGLPLDQPDIYIYRQSFIPAHSELTWILDCFTGFGEMRRMEQFESKAGLTRSSGAEIYLYAKRRGGKYVLDTDDIHKLFEQYKHDVESFKRLLSRHHLNNRKLRNITTGLFNYPVLMAADILLYGATYVPVGDDQTQHLEFTRDIAERMNNKFGELFQLPLPVQQQHEFFGKDQGLRIRDLMDPTKKMSKSDATGKGVVFLQDTPESVRKKIMSATTDSLGAVAYDYATQPGISNLLDILKLLGGDPAEFIGQPQYGPLKTRVAEMTAEFITDFQAKLAAVDESALIAKLEASEVAMDRVAKEKLSQVQRALGLRSA